MMRLHLLLLLLLLASLVAAVPHPQEEADEETAEDEEATEEDEEELVGAFVNYSPGLLEPTSEDLDNANEFVSFFNDLVGESNTPESYNAVKEGLISPVKNQGYCGSCAAFATTSVLETCNKKVTQSFGNYSEQQFLDCAYGHIDANACQGAQLYAYLDWAFQNKTQLANGKQFPYKGEDSPFDCPSPMPYDPKAAVVSSLYYTYNGTEDRLKNLVFDNDAVVIGVWFTEKSWTDFQNYRKGVFQCTDGGRPKGGHAMVAVGYGREKGKDYWLIKNSWGPKWGEKGYIKLLRGNSTCGIGRAVVVMDCELPPKKKKQHKKKASKVGAEAAEDEGDEEYDEEEE